MEHVRDNSEASVSLDVSVVFVAIEYPGGARGLVRGFKEERIGQE
jgi:hypothetical protein